ncbi:hypothetical protein AAVH_06569 [Aphelenchoides avenae]|nr:hypothetical protein AAVH_06569 [Aphelenchus avenae]
MNKQVLLSATHNDTTHFRTNPTKDFIVPDDAIIPRAATSSSSSGANLIAHGDDNPDKPGSSRQYTAVLEHRRKSKKRHWQKKQSKEKFDGNILPRNKKSRETKLGRRRRVFLESDSSSSEEFFDSGLKSLESPKKPRLHSPLAADHPAPKYFASPPAQKERKESSSMTKESRDAGTHLPSAVDDMPDHVVPSSTASFVGHPSAHPGKQVPSAKCDPASADTQTALSEEEKVAKNRRRVREHIEGVIWKKVTFEKMIHRDYYANIAPNVAALEKKLFEVHQTTKGGYKRWCLDFFAVLNDELNVLFKAVLYGHLTPAELVALSAEQMQAPRFRIKFPPLSLGPDETCCKPITSDPARRHNNGS